MKEDWFLQCLSEPLSKMNFQELSNHFDHTYSPLIIPLLNLHDDPNMPTTYETLETGETTAWAQ